MEQLTDVIDRPKQQHHSKESEMMVLGCMLTNQDALEAGCSDLDPSDFYFSEHETIFKVLRHFYVSKKPVDAHLICEELKRQDKLSSVGGAQYIVSLAQFVGTSSYVEDYIEGVKNKSLLRSLMQFNRQFEKEAVDGVEHSQTLLEKLQTSLKTLESKHARKLPIISPEERLRKEENFLSAYRGKKYLGLCVKTIQEFNENFLGLRSLNLLAAAPNVGKTALTIQTAIEVLLREESACLVYVSLEMTKEQIFRRMLLFLSNMNFRTFVFGSKTEAFGEKASFFTQDEHERIERAKTILCAIGDRLQIIDQSTSPTIDSRTIINYVEALKQRTKTSRSIVIIDYLQVWPTSSQLRFSNEIETDKWRIGEMKKIRDAMNDDPVIVISEARKPSGNEDTWGGDLSDVMGSARGTYTPDVVMLLSQLKHKALFELWKKNGLPEIPLESGIDCQENEKLGMAIKLHLAKHGIAICKLEVPKARDGMQKFSTLLEFHFNKNTFNKIDWESLKKLSLPSKQRGLF